MTTLATIQRTAERFGVQVKTTKRPGISHHIDIDRIRPMRDFHTVIDVGANIGNTVSFYADRCPNAVIHAFEPAPANVRQLTARIESEGLIPRVKVHREAVGAVYRRGVVMYEPEYCEWWTLTPELNHPNGERGYELVDVTTIDTLCSHHEITRIDLLKTDTDGSEVEVLQGAERMLSAHRIDFIYAEVCFETDFPRATYFPRVLEYLTPLGYHFLGLYDVAHFTTPNRLGWCNALFTHL